MIDIIKSEIIKDNPDWLLVSKIASQLAESTKPTDPLGFKTGYVNFIKQREYSGFLGEIRTIKSDKYEIVYCEYIRDLNKIISEADLDSKYFILVSPKDMVSNLTALNKPLLRFNGSEHYDKNNQRYFSLKNKTTNERIVFKKGELKAIMRDRALSELIK